MLNKRIHHRGDGDIDDIAELTDGRDRGLFEFAPRDLDFLARGFAKSDHVFAKVIAHIA
jgi:hypothetical protein